MLEMRHEKMKENPILYSGFNFSVITAGVLIWSPFHLEWIMSMKDKLNI